MDGSLLDGRSLGGNLYGHVEKSRLPTENEK